MRERRGKGKERRGDGGEGEKGEKGRKRGKGGADGGILNMRNDQIGRV